MFVVRPFQATTLAYWYGERDQLDLSPPYQRSSGVWSNTDKAFLIDSIINGYDIPKFYIADFSYVSSALNLKGRPYAVIDGRQRFEAIFDFLDNRFRLNNDMVYLGEERISLAGLLFNEIKEQFPKIAQRIENFNINVMSVLTDQEEKINDLFVRLNKSKPLTGAEVRSAMVGEVTRLIRQIAKSDFFKKYVSFNTKRKQDENVAAKILLIEHRSGFVDTKKVNLDRFAMEAALTETEFNNSAERVLEVLDAMCEIFEPGDSLLRSSGIVPLYYWLAKHYPNVDLRWEMQAFEEYRKDNPSTAPIAAYNKASRSTNDLLSYKVRYAVLEAFLKLEPGNSLPNNLVANLS
ncbi:GmrSD restriction endonuclease domain-containing protein [Telluria antibiotica]|nr:DUF262 domain-containing protein [Telluria antibiotica]